MSIFGFYTRPKPTPLAPAAPEPRRLRRISCPTMGTRFRASFVAGPDITDPALAKALFAAVDAVDQAMSTWKETSALMAFNRAPLNQWEPVPLALAQVVQTGLKISAATQGAFDMTLGAAVNAWGFGARRVTHLPKGPQSLGQYRALEARLSPPALRKSAAMMLDLSGIAKGFGVDELAQVLHANGITDYLVEIDGEVRASGRKPGLDGLWAVALEAPTQGQRTAWDVLDLRDCALATSGDYRHFVHDGGKQRAHTMDGRTGWPVDNALASVTVRHASCMIADAWASALMVLGPHDGAAVAEAQNIAALFLIRDGAAIIEKRSSLFGND